MVLTRQEVLQGENSRCDLEPGANGVVWPIIESIFRRSGAVSCLM